VPFRAGWRLGLHSDHGLVQGRELLRDLQGVLAMIAKQASDRSFVVDTFEERHFTLAEIAKMWCISHEKARRLFHNEPGVIRFHGQENSSRKYNTYRVPESVARRVRLRLMNI